MHRPNVSCTEKRNWLRSRRTLATLVASVAIATFVNASSASAAAITFSTTGSGSDGSLAASARFTTTAGQIQIVLTNDLAANVIRSAGQALSDISFTLSNAAGTVGSVSASGQFGTIGSTHSVTYVAGAPTRWLGVGGGEFTVTGSTVLLEAIGGGQPTQMIAPFIANGGTYTNLNDGFANFNPYVIGPATFTLALSGVSSNTTVTGVTFSFGTGPDTFLPGTCTANCSGGTGGGGQTVPEPASLLLFGSGLAGLAYARRRAL